MALCVARTFLLVTMHTATDHSTDVRLELQSYNFFATLSVCGVNLDGKNIGNPSEKYEKRPTTLR